jgi:hypothetical protein
MIMESNETMQEQLAQETATQGTATQDTQEPLTFEAMMATLPEDQRTQVETHIAGMSTALKQERDERKRLERELKKVTPIAEEGTQVKQQLEQVAAAAAEEAARAAFYEQAMQAGVQRSSMRLAYLAARDAGLLAADGVADWDAMQESYPNLFEQPGAAPVRAPAARPAPARTAPPPDTRTGSQRFSAALKDTARTAAAQEAARMRFEKPTA